MGWLLRGEFSAHCENPSDCDSSQNPDCEKAARAQDRAAVSLLLLESLLFSATVSVFLSWCESFDLDVIFIAGGSALPLVSFPSSQGLADLLRSGASSVPVALVPTDGGTIPMKNPKAIKVELRKATSHFQEIAKVHQFGRGSVLFFSADQECIPELRQCSESAAHPVSTFISPHLACSKGLVYGVDTSLTPAEVLNLFSVAGVILRTGAPIHLTESVKVTILGTVRPSEIKAWPLMYKGSHFFTNPYNFGYVGDMNIASEGADQFLDTVGVDKNHDSCECSSEKERCCSCIGRHPA